MLVSVIICTIRRDELIRQLLDELGDQTYRQIEVLIVGKEGDVPREESLNGLRLRRLPAPKGLAEARNVGLDEAEGELICFFDDDVVIERRFFEKAVALFERPDFAEVGGLTGFDHYGYDAEVSGRWRMRRRLGLSKTLEPGESDHMGRTVPLSFFKPFSGVREVRWMPGFCQIFRREAITGLRYDVLAVAEDRDFAMAVGAKGWRMMISGDLYLEHRRDSEARHSPSRQARRAAFALGRIFAKRRRRFSDWWLIVKTLVGEFVIDLLVLAARPSLENLKIPFRRIDGYLAGLFSYRRPAVTEQHA